MKRLPETGNDRTEEKLEARLEALKKQRAEADKRLYALFARIVKMDDEIAERKHHLEWGFTNTEWERITTK